MSNGKCLIDYNRAGMPLLEIVTDAQWTNPDDCKLVVYAMQELLSTLGISEAKVEQGQMRVDVNISVWSTTDKSIRSPRVEIKNVDGEEDFSKLIRAGVVDIKKTRTKTQV